MSYWNSDTAPPSIPANGTRQGRVGVIDIGSNTLRLVVYDTPTRLPFPIFNEKAQCELGRGMGASGRLNPDGVLLAMKSLARFLRLAQSMGVESLQLVATAAVRDAADGLDFVAAIRERFGAEIRLLSGQEEAELAAIGMLSGVPEADGILGDLGGGSLDLVELCQGDFGRHATLPLGHLRLAEMSCSGKGCSAPPDQVAGHFASVPWLDRTAGKTFYAIGGSWRAIARVLIDQTGYPLHVIDNFGIDSGEAARLLKLISGLSRESLEKIRGVPKRRLLTLPCAATAMAATIEAVRPNRVVFSAFGMREGVLISSLPPEMRVQDPLIAACETHAERTGRFPSGGRELLEWTSPLFPEETMVERRLRYAACLISDIGWTEHPDYRADIAFERTLKLPFAGLTHADRVVLAIAVHVRYNGDPEAPISAPYRDIIDEAARNRAKVLGLALRLANTVSGGAPGMLPRTELRVAGGHLRMILPNESEVFIGEAVERRFRTLARAMNLGDDVVI